VEEKKRWVDQEEIGNDKNSRQRIWKEDTREKEIELREKERGGGGDLLYNDQSRKS